MVLTARQNSAFHEVNPRRGASGFLWPKTLDVELVPSPEGCGEWTHLQSSGGRCRDGSGSEDGDVCSIEKTKGWGSRAS